MEDLKLVPFADPSLKKAPALFDFETGDPDFVKRQLIHHMNKFRGVGLSANQVGYDMRVFVIGNLPEVDDKVFFNPELMDISEEQVTMREGCLSYPGLWLNLKRPAGCLLKYYDENNVETVEEFRGLCARVVLHEYDHMVGQNFTMRASPLKLQRALDSFEKKVKRHTRKQRKA